MGKDIDLVRYRNDGDDFHVLWTARRTLRMLDPNSGLVAVAVEGASERERAPGARVEAGLLVVDTAEYYGSEDLTKATQVVYVQLKYSTTRPDALWTAVGLKGTLKGFAQRFVALCDDIGPVAVVAKVRFRFVSNRPISASVQRALAAVVAGLRVARLDKRTKAARESLLKATGLTVAEFRKFAALVDLLGNEEPRDAQARALSIDSSRFSVFLDSDASKRMKDLVREKALSKSANDNTITLDTLLHQFGLGSERELLPAEPKFETLANLVPRAQEPRIAQTILAARWPVVIRAAGGVGKSVLAQRLPAHLPPGSEAVVFDGFAGGDYRNPRLHRHKHSRGLIHMANELARRGLCDVLIPQHGASEQQYLEAFRNRLQQAAAVVRSRSPDAVLLTVIDAADNLGMAAEDVHERSFAVDLLQEAPPEGCHIVALARTHRVEKYLRPAGTVVSIDLEPFTLAESTEHLRRKFPSASDDDVRDFHRFTDRNPRVQANALAVAGDLPSLRNALGPNVETADDLIAGQLDAALDKVIHEQASSHAEIEPLCTALAALSPPVPVRILARAAALSEDAVRSFISDFAKGRPIVISDGAVQFRDEPVETWFRDHFLGTPGHYGRIADLLAPLAVKDAYAAAVLPILLHRAERYEELMQLALEGAEPETDDPMERREVLLRRVQYALKAALSQNRLGDAAKLLLRAGEEVAANDRQISFLMDHADLVSSLAGPDVASDFIFRRRPWEKSEKGYAYCAAMLAADHRNSVDAERFLSLAWLWLGKWFAEQRARADEHPWVDRVRMESEDIAAYAEAIRSLHGSSAMLRFMENWHDWAAFEATRTVASRLLDRGDTAGAEELLAVARDRTAVRLAVILEMNSVCIVPSARHVRSTFALLTSDKTRVDLGNYPEDTEILLAVAATAEMAVRSAVPVSKVVALLDRYPFASDRVHEWFERGGRREATLRAAALKAALRGRWLTLDDVTPASVRKALKEPGSEHKREVQRLREVYGPLVPWYRLRAVALAGGAEDWDGSVATAQKECRTDRWGWGGSPDMAMAVNEIGGIWFEALIWSGRGNDASASEVEKWLASQQMMITVPKWTSLARRAAVHHAVCRDSALRFARRARETIEDDHTDARQAADSFAALARAILPLGREEASGYFQKALEHLSRLGDELHERLFSALALAAKAGQSGRPNPREAYRVARMGELFHAYNAHKFPWGDVADAVTRMCPASGFAVASRWSDRSQALSLERTLPSVVLYLLEAGVIRPTVAASLHALGGYWHLRKWIPSFLDKEPDRKLKQAVLDTLALDEEFARNREENSAGALLDAAERHGLRRQRLQDLVNFRAKMSDRYNHRSRTWADGHHDVPPTHDWAAILSGIDLHTPEGVDDAIARWQATKGSSDWEDFLAHMRRAVDPGRRPDHVLALVRSQELMVGLVLDALEACATDWGASLAVERALVNAVKVLAGERAADMIGSGWGINEIVRRCAALSRLPSQDVLNGLMQGLADQVEHVSGGALFNLAGALAAGALSPEQAKDALAFGLDRLEPVLKEDDGDGPWQEYLEPPSEVPRAVAGLLYAMLASPEAEMRWRAAHAVRRLCRFGEKQIVSALVDLLPSEALPAFTDAGLPFYALHARLYLLIALARAAEEAPDVLVPHVREFLRWALEDTPHVLIRHFAARAALELERCRAGLLDQTTIHRLRAVNISPFPAEPRKHGQPTGWTDQVDRRTGRFPFGYDFDRYWLGALGAAFNLPHAFVAERAERWIVDRWGKRRLSTRDLDPRARRNVYRGETYASHGSYPSVDRYSFYLSYHAMFCTAGELLAEFPPSIKHGDDAWEYWLRRHLLTRPDGRWLADRRDVEPLEVRRWQLEEDEWERRNEWQHSVLPEDFDHALGIDAEVTRVLAVWGWWIVKRGDRKETIHVSSALATPTTSISLLRALQTIDDPYDYRVPRERDEVEIDLPGFQLCGWIADPHSDTGLDEFDPFAGVPWPGPRPGRRVRRLVKLVGDTDGRVWLSDGTPAMGLEIWGDHRNDRHRSVGNHGERLTADLSFLLVILRHLDRDLIIDVGIERKDGREETNETKFVHRRYTRIYLLRGDGQLHTLDGCRRLRPQADR